MTDYLTDEEQVERIKKWWAENGTSVIAGLVIGFGLLGGWRFWVDYRANTAADASAYFSEVVSALAEGKPDLAMQQANVIVDDYATTAYGDLARLALAKALVEKGDFGQAEQQLSLLVGETRDAPIEMLARVRLAAVMLQQDKLDAALQTLAIDYPTQFTAAFEEMRGDILARKGDKARAAEAYRKAQLAQPPVPNAQFLQQKLQDLGATDGGS